MKKTAIASVAAMLIAGAAMAQTPYGPPITLEQARKCYAAAEAEAARNKWPVSIAVLDSGGHLKLLQTMDNTQLASPEIAREKAWSAFGYRRPTKALQDALAAGGEGWRFLQLHRAVSVDGGLPIISDGKIIGAVGVSGVASVDDGKIAKACADVMK
jgi:uncharacterized protein GlcG (DUF336 family)